MGSFLIRTENKVFLNAASDVLILPLLQDEALFPLASSVDSALDSVVSHMIEQREFRCDWCEIDVIPTFGRQPAPRVALLGLGKRTELTASRYGLAIAAASRALAKRGLSRAEIDVTDAPIPAADAARAVAEGAELARYIGDPYRTGERRPVAIAEWTVVGAPEDALADGSIRGRAKNFARDLVNEPANVLNPTELAHRAEAMAAAVGLDCEVLDVPAMERLGMGAILAVNRGTQSPARFIILRHRGAEDGPHLMLVGKAVTFDTGGISLKPVQDMGKMKGDMAGGAAVLGAMQAIAELGVPLNVTGLVPAVENMPSGSAWRPGDVITAMSGKTIETITTDAEGRMLLADTHYRYRYPHRCVCRGAGPCSERALRHGRRTRHRSSRLRRAGRRTTLADAPVSRVQGADPQRDRGSQEQWRSSGRVGHRGLLHPGVRSRHAVGAPRYSRHEQV
jgi:leucyl aminopeptidase